MSARFFGIVEVSRAKIPDGPPDLTELRPVDRETQRIVVDLPDRPGVPRLKVQRRPRVDPGFRMGSIPGKGLDAVLCVLLGHALPGSCTSPPHCCLKSATMRGRTLCWHRRCIIDPTPGRSDVQGQIPPRAGAQAGVG